MTIIDYTVLFYTSLSAISVPAVVTGKFVQIRSNNTLYLVFSPKEFTRYHANIVERFCMDKGIEGSYDSKREKFTITDQSLQIAGGGKFERDANKKTIKLYDNSMAYGKFDVPGLKETLSAVPELSGYTITIE